jgi:hypothetical protein
MKILRENLIRYKNDKSKVLLVTNAYNVIFNQGPEFVLDKFQTLKPARIVFGAEDICWPDEKLQVIIDRLIFYVFLNFVI